MKKVLPIQEPIIGATIHQAMIFSVMPMYEECIPWLINNYVSLFCLKNLYKQKWNRRGSVDFFYSLYGDWSMFEFSANPWLDYEALSFSAITDNHIELIPFLENALNQDKYLHVSIDWFYIPIYEQYQNDHGMHHLFINGYDSEKRIFYAHDTYKDGKYAPAEVAYDDLLAGFEALIDDPETANSWQLGLFMFKIGMRSWHEVHTGLYQFNPKLLVHFLKDYLYGCAHGFKGDDLENFCFGIACYDELILFIQKALDRAIDNIDFRGFCNMQDHKKVMLFRLQWLEEHLGLDLSTECESYQKMIQGFDLIVYKIIKWNYGKRDTAIKTLPNLLTELREQEIVTIKKIISKLEIFYQQ
jgi:hypothetical protein